MKVSYSITHHSVLATFCTGESKSHWEKQTLSVFTQLLQGQEESKHVMKEMQNEITQV